MVELTLPKNSRVVDGKVWPKPANAIHLTEFRIYRYDPDGESNPRMDTYYVDRDDCGPMVLDGIIWIKSKIDPTLTFRRSLTATDLTYNPQCGPTIGTWVAATVQVGTPVSNGDGTETVTFRDNVSSTLASRRFMRLQVTRSP